MSALVTADLHLSAKVRDSYRFEAMGVIARLLEANGCCYLIILGDLTQEKDYHPATLVNDLVDVIYSFSQIVEVIVLLGNHDYTQIDSPFFQFLRRLRRVRFITKLTRVQLPDLGDCLFLPHTRDYKTDWAVLPQLEEIDWIFAHNTFEGASSEHGKKLSGIPTNFIGDNFHVISGDIHTPQDVGPVTYVGAPYLVNFGDDYDPRVLLIDGKSKRRSEKSLTVPGRQKRLIDITTEDIDEDRLDRFDLAKGDIIKARVLLKLSEQDKWFAIRDQVKRELAERGLVVELVQPITTAKTQSVRLNRPQAKSDELVVKEYGKSVKATEATLKLGLAFLTEA